jgi:hypothetical protein
MHELMAGMFWGGLVMALPPVILGVWLVIFLLRRQRQGEADDREQAR